MTEFKKYRRKGFAEMRPYELGESLIGISVNKEDHPPTDMGMIARNPNNHNDQWYVARKWFEDNYEEEKLIKDALPSETYAHYGRFGSIKRGRKL